MSKSIRTRTPKFVPRLHKREITHKRKRKEFRALVWAVIREVKLDLAAEKDLIQAQVLAEKQQLAFAAHMEILENSFLENLAVQQIRAEGLTGSQESKQEQIDIDPCPIPEPWDPLSVLDF